MQTIRPISPGREPAPEMIVPLAAIPGAASVAGSGVVGRDGVTPSLPPIIENGFRMLRVPRIEDLPYATSPPVQWVYESTANLAAGQYVWADVPAAMVYNRPVLTNVVYYIRNISLTADITEADFTSNLAVSPTFQLYFSLDPFNVLLREPFLMNKFYDQFDFRYMLLTQKDGNTLFGAFLTGTIRQGANLIGKQNITLKMVLSAQEIADQYFVEAFLKGYPPD